MDVINNLLGIVNGSQSVRVQVELRPDDIVKVAAAVFVGVLIATLLAGLIVKRYA